MYCSVTAWRFHSVFNFNSATTAIYAGGFCAIIVVVSIRDFCSRNSLVLNPTVISARFEHDIALLVWHPSVGFDYEIAPRGLSGNMV